MSTLIAGNPCKVGPLGGSASGVDVTSSSYATLTPPALLLAVGLHPSSHQANFAPVNVHVDVVGKPRLAVPSSAAAVSLGASGNKTPYTSDIAAWRWGRRGTPIVHMTVQKKKNKI